MGEGSLQYLNCYSRLGFFVDLEGAQILAKQIHINAAETLWGRPQLGQRKCCDIPKLKYCLTLQEIAKSVYTSRQYPILTPTPSAPWQKLGTQKKNDAIYTMAQRMNSDRGDCYPWTIYR